MCPPTRADSHHLASTIELVFPSACLSLQPKQQINRFSHFCTATVHGRVSSGTLAPPGEYDWIVLPSAHPSPQPKWQLDQFSHFCTAHDRKSLYFTMCTPFPLKITPSHGGIWTPSNIWFLLCIGAQNPNGILIGSAVFLAQMTAKCLYTVQWASLPPPLKIATSHGGCGPHPYLIYGSFSPPESSTQTASRLLQPFLQGSLVWQTDRQRDQATRLITTGHIYGRCGPMIININNYKFA